MKKIEEEYKPLKNKYEEDVGKLNEKITILTNKCQNLEKKLNEENGKSKILIHNNNSKDEILELMKEIKSKNEELNLIKSKIGFDIKDNEEIMTIIFKSMDQKIHHAFICKDSDKL